MQEVYHSCFHLIIFAIISCERFQHFRCAKRVLGECKRLVSPTHSPFQETFMQPYTDLLDALRTDLAELTALHAPSGAEQPVIARLPTSSLPWSMRSASIT